MEPIKYTFVKTTTNFHRFDETGPVKVTTGSIYINKMLMPTPPATIFVEVK
jgi:hypothetical protein